MVLGAVIAAGARQAARLDDLDLRGHEPSGARRIRRRFMLPARLQHVREFRAKAMMAT
jgi:hypothetical protein